MTEQLDFTAAVERDIFGSYDANIRSIEKNLDVSVLLRDGHLCVTGEEKNVREASNILRQLARLTESGGEVDTQQVNYAIAMKEENEAGDMLSRMDQDIICHTVTGKPVRPKTLGQAEYIRAVREHMITFANGPAGTGKTYLAMALAVTAFQREEIQRIILTRPAIEAGEKLGFLPGDLQQKIDPYLRPLYDALYQLMGAENFQRNQEKGLIEVAPLAYMRGRTLDNAFIILDEAQNTTRIWVPGCDHRRYDTEGPGTRCSFRAGYRGASAEKYRWDSLCHADQQGCGTSPARSADCQGI